MRSNTQIHGLMLSGLHLNINMNVKSELGLSFCSTDQFLEEIKDQLFKFRVSCLICLILSLPASLKM